jgi:hypothetical protein
MQVLNLGPVEARALVILRALQVGYTLTSSPSGTWLSTGDEEPIAIPRDVMEWLIASDLLQFHKAH